MISLEEKQKIVDELNKKFDSIELKCPMCGKKQFTIGDGYFNTILQKDFNNLNLMGPSIPSIPIICDNCGFISMHALGVLDLLPKQDDDKNKGGKDGK